MVRLSQDAFLSELSKLYQKSKNSGSVQISLKRWETPEEGKSSAKGTKLGKKPPGSGEFVCLVHARLGSKKISTLVPFKDHVRFQKQFGAVIKVGTDGLLNRGDAKKSEKALKRSRQEKRQRDHKEAKARSAKRQKVDKAGDHKDASGGSSSKGGGKKERKQEPGAGGAAAPGTLGVSSGGSAAEAQHATAAAGSTAGQPSAGRSAEKPGSATGKPAAAGGAMDVSADGKQQQQQPQQQQRTKPEKGKKDHGKARS